MSATDREEGDQASQETDVGTDDETVAPSVGLSATVGLDVGQTQTLLVSDDVQALQIWVSFSFFGIYQVSLTRPTPSLLPNMLENRIALSGTPSFDTTHPVESCVHEEPPGGACSGTLPLEHPPMLGSAAASSVAQPSLIPMGGTQPYGPALRSARAQCGVTAFDIHVGTQAECNSRLHATEPPSMARRPKRGGAQVRRCPRAPRRH